MVSHPAPKRSLLADDRHRVGRPGGCRQARQWAGLGALARGKVIRLLVPLVTVGIVVFLAKRLNPTSTSGLVAGDWCKVYIVGLDHLWFLQVIFVIFLVVGLLDR